MTGAGGYARPSRLCFGRSSQAKMSAVITQRLGTIFMSNENLNRLSIVIAIALIMLIAVMVTDSRAKGVPREGNSPEISEWFRSQHNALGGWCCNDADGHRYYGDYVLNSDGSVTISPGTPDAHQIEAYKVLSGTNPTGTAVWWYNEGQAGTKTTYCFAPGSLT